MELAEHSEWQKTLEILRQRFNRDGCQQAVVDWIANCTLWIAARGPVKSRDQLQQYNSGAPFERIAMDVADPFSVSNAGDRYVLVVVNNGSVYQTQSIGEHNNKCFFKQLGMSLRGSKRTTFPSRQKFRVSCFKETYSLYGINKTRITPLHPQSDGILEQFNRTLEEYLRSIVSEQQKVWDEDVPRLLLAYRSAVNDSKSRSPA